MNPSFRPEAWKTAPLGLEGRRVLVTGGTTGLGRSIALLLASQGARVLIFGRDERHLADALESMAEFSSNVFGLNADVTEAAGRDAVFEAVSSELGGLDALVNNAGVPAEGPLQMEEDAIEHAVHTNLIAYLLMAKRAVPLFAEGSGFVVNIGSLSAKARGGGTGVYVATKTGVRGFSEALAKEVGERGIRVSLIEPGKTGADFFKPGMDGEDMRESHDDGEMLFSESIAEAVRYVLTRPMPCHVPLMQVQPLGEQVD